MWRRLDLCPTWRKSCCLRCPRSSLKFVTAGCFATRTCPAPSPTSLERCWSLYSLLWTNLETRTRGAQESLALTRLAKEHCLWTALITWMALSMYLFCRRSQGITLCLLS
eukprot:Rmarinus@m.25184